MSLRKTILAVDDVTSSLKGIHTILSAEFVICLAKSGDVAISIIDNRKIDLILLDIEMPKISGFDFIDILIKRQAEKNISVPIPPIIFVTSHASPEFVMRAAQLGVRDYLVKPFAPDVLRSKVYSVLKLVRI